MQKFFRVQARTNGQGWSDVNLVGYVEQAQEDPARRRAASFRDQWLIALPEWDWRVLPPVVSSTPGWSL